MFDLERIAATGLVARIDYHESLASTSDQALALAAEGEAALPLLVLTERQTAGRGRGTNRWFSEAGSLTFSLVLQAPPEQLPSERWPQVSLAAGVAVCEAIEELVPRAPLQIKWPNDVFLTGRKLGGILCESAAGWRDRLVVGVGVNVWNRVEEVGGLRGEVRGQSSEGGGQQAIEAISLVEHDGVVRELTGVLIELLDHFQRRWSDLISGKGESVLAGFSERCFLTGRTLVVEQAGKVQRTGICRGIDGRGRLRLETAGGPVAIESGTILKWE